MEHGMNEKRRILTCPIGRHLCPKYRSARTILLSTTALFAFALTANAAGTSKRSVDALSMVNSFLGADGGGNTVPGASVPFGFASVSPDTTGANTSGYDSAGRILGFSHTHVSGTGGGSKYGNFRVTPTVGPIRVNNLAFTKTAESARPGYYSVTLNLPKDSPVYVELTANRLTSYERFTFSPGANANLILEATSAIPLGGDGNQQHPTAAEVNIIDDHQISGWASFAGGWNPAPYKMYFYAVFNRPMSRWGTWTATLANSQVFPDHRQLAANDLDKDHQNRLGLYATFDTANSTAVEMKLGLSFVGIDQAKKNVSSEIPEWGFEAAVKHAAGLWRSALDKIEIRGGTDSEQRIFYSCLYRSHTMPHDLTGENAWWKSAEPHYEDFYTIWDTFRTLHPLLTMIDPDRQRDMVRSLVDTYEHTGWIPDARIAGASGLVQGGSNAEVLIADAIVKGLQGIDYDKAYAAIVKDAERQSPDPLNVGRELEDYRRLGYMSLTQTRSASRTMEYSYDDFAIAQVAERLGHHEDARKYLKRSRNWQNLWNPANLCIQPRYSDGRWLEYFDCDREYPDHTTAWWDAPFYEGRPRQYATFVPHDMANLIGKCGGDHGFVKWLDILFDRGLYAQGNEPDMLAPYLYIHAGRHDRTAKRVRAILSKEYRNERTGLPGNDDAGAMSSWYVWSAIGLFPNAGQPFYYIGSPLFLRSTIQVGSGRRLVIEAQGNSPKNIYVQRAEWNGKPLTRAWLTHDEVKGGGTLALHMGPYPAPWAERGPRPPSMNIEE